MVDAIISGLLIQAPCAVVCSLAVLYHGRGKLNTVKEEIEDDIEKRNDETEEKLSDQMKTSFENLKESIKETMSHQKELSELRSKTAQDSANQRIEDLAALFKTEIKTIKLLLSKNGSC